MVSQSVIKVLVVDDSAFMRKLIQDFISEQPNMAVVGTARNGKDAIAKMRLLKPHVMTMDVEMPVMDGLEALKIIMQESPLPVIMLSSTTKQGAENTLTAMEYGAVDFVTKPSGTISLDLHKVKDDLIAKIHHASNVKMMNLSPRFREAAATQERTVPAPAPVKKQPAYRPTSLSKLVLIGTSTGGPRALQEVITTLPKTIQAPVVIVQHMPAGFTKSLANRLDGLSHIHVKEAENGERLEKGVAYIAPGGFHLKVETRGPDLVARLDDGPAVGGHRPSVDVLFESAALVPSVEKVVVVMTGMGADGSKGMVKLNHNPHVRFIAESQETCIVFGMPKAAIATGLVNEVVELNQISKTIMNYLP